MRHRSLGGTGWLSPCLLAAMLQSSPAAAQPLEGDAAGRLPDVEGEAVPAEGAEPPAPGDAAGAPSEGAEVPPPPAAPATESTAGEDAAREAEGEAPPPAFVPPPAPAYEPPPPPPERRAARRRSGGGAGFSDGDTFLPVYVGGGYPWGVSEGKGGIRFEGRGSFTLGGQLSFGQSKGWGFAVGLEHSALFTQSKVGDSEVPVQFVESWVMPLGVYVRAGDGVLVEAEVLLALGAMRFENIGKMEFIVAFGGRLGALIALKELEKATFFVNPRVDYLAHKTANIEMAQFIVPTANLGFLF